MKSFEQLDLPDVDKAGNVLDKEGYIVKESLDAELSRIIEKLKARLPKEGPEEIMRMARDVRNNPKNKK
jgi:hypothetical protein